MFFFSHYFLCITLLFLQDVGKLVNILMIFHKAPVGSRNHKKVFYIEGQIVSQTVLAKLVSKRTALMCKPRSRVLLVNMKREQLNLSLALRQWKPAK